MQYAYILIILYINSFLCMLYEKGWEAFGWGTIIIKSFPKTLSPFLPHNFFKGIFIQEILAKEYKYH